MFVLMLQTLQEQHTVLKFLLQLQIQLLQQLLQQLLHQLAISVPMQVEALPVSASY